MNYILLKDKGQCPRCDKPHKLTARGRCKSCGVLLFFNGEFNFSAYEDDGNLRIYWLWTPEYGWKHRDYVMNLRAEAQRADEKIEQAALNTDKRITHDI
jgi:hypothetical protein